MKGLYMYGIRAAPGLSKPLFIRCIDGFRGKVFAVPYKDVEAMVSEVAVKDFDSDEIQRKAAEDPQWIKEKAVLHANAIAAVSRHGGAQVIPMKFGVIFKTKRNLEESLRKKYASLKNLLREFDGKEEWAVKVYVKKPLFRKRIEEGSSLIQNAFSALKARPAGEDYFAKKDIEADIDAKVRMSLGEFGALWMKRLGEVAERATENKLLGMELTQKSEPMVFNGAFLIRKEKANGFLAEIADLEEEFSKRGFIFEASGPWLPYSFIPKVLAGKHG